MRGSLSGGYVRKTGDTMTGPLTISANAAPVLTIKRPDGTSSDLVMLQVVGVSDVNLHVNTVQPRLRIRDGAAVDRLTLDISNGLLGAGLIPLSLLQVQESFASNAGAVAVLAANTTVVSAAVITVAVGDRILIGYEVAHLKGAVAGDSRFFLQQTAGAGTVLFLNNAGALAGVGAIANLPNQVNATTWPASGFVEARATVAGTVTLSLVGASQGSNGNVAIGDGQIHVAHLRG